MFRSEHCEGKTDEELVELTVHDQNFLTCLIEKYEQPLLRYIKRITSVPQEEAEDILQEVFIKVYYNLHGFDTSLKFSSWVYRITHNEVISTHRKTQARPHGHTIDVEDEVLQQIASDFDIVEKAETAVLQTKLAEVFASMEDKYSEVLILKFLEDKDYKEISDILKKPMGTVATLISRAKQQFREQVKARSVALDI